MTFTRSATWTQLTLRLNSDLSESVLGSRPVQPSQCLFSWKTLFWCKDIFTCFSTDFHNVSTRFLINWCNVVTTFELITSRVVSSNSSKPFYFLKFVFQPLAIFFIFSLAFPSYKSVSENSTWRPNKIYVDRLSVWLSPPSNEKRRKENFMIFSQLFRSASSRCIDKVVFSRFSDTFPFVRW